MGTNSIGSKPKTSRRSWSVDEGINLVDGRAGPRLQPDEVRVSGLYITMSKDAWVRMGRPMRVTVTLYPDKRVKIATSQIRYLSRKVLQGTHTVRVYFGRQHRPEFIDGVYGITFLETPQRAELFFRMISHQTPTQGNT